MTQYKMNEIDPKHKLVISTPEYGIIQTYLPEQFGFTVGSEFSAPFDQNLLGGTLQKVAAVSGFANKRGIATKKMYSNPEPTEISFELVFDAYYSAREEVLVPVIKLMCSAVGQEVTWDVLDEKFKKLVRTTSGAVANPIDSLLGGDSDSSSSIESEGDNLTLSSTGVSKSRTSERILELLSFIAGPDKVSMSFGSVYRLPEVWISSVSAMFDNTVDAQGFPMRATVNLTCQVEKDPVKEDIMGFFSRYRGNDS